MREVISVILLIIGAAFILISALGVVRMPDLYLRMSASTKSSTLGVGTILLATAVYFGELGIASRAIATIIFLLITAPVAAHMMGRAAYFNGVPLWEGSLYDDLKGKYDVETHTLLGSGEIPESDSNSEETRQSSAF
jgi:multicomponent Na+:H+ antiporter subunit G